MPEEKEVPEGAAVFPEIPAELGVNPLLLAVIHAVVFLGGSDDEIVLPEAADEALEWIATYLQRLDEPAIERISEDLRTLRGYAKEQGWPKQLSEFLKSFLKDLDVEK